jgi:hypothetical protein
LTAGGVVSSRSRAMSFRASPPSSRDPSPGSSCSDDDDEILDVIRAEIARRDDASRRARHQSASASATVVQRGRAPLAAPRVPPARRAPAPPRVPVVPSVRDARRSSNSTAGTLPPIVTSSSRTSSSRTSSSTVPTSAPRGPPPPPPSHASSTAALAELEAALADDAAFRALVRGPPPEWESTANRAATEASAADRDGEDLRAKISHARTRVDALAKTFDALGEIEALSRELGERTETFSREVDDAARAGGS